MVSLARYVVKIGTTYHYRRRVPEGLRLVVGQAFWKQSLRTSIQHEAEARARLLAVEHDLLIQSFRDGSPLEQLKVLIPREAEARKALGSRLREQFARQPSSWDRACEVVADGIDADTVRISALALTVRQKADQDCAISAQSRLVRLDRADQQLVAELGGVEAFIKYVRNEQRDLSDLDSYLALASKGASAETLAMVAPEHRGSVAPVNVMRRGKASMLAEYERVLARLGIELAGQSENPKDPRINTAIESWFAEKRQGASAVKRHRVAVRRFVELNGNLRVREITSDMIESFRDAIAKLPDHRRVPTDQRGGIATSFDDRDLPRVSAKTVERHLITMRAFLKYCKDKKFVATNEASGIKAPPDTRPKASKRRAFLREERQALLAQVIEERGPESDEAWFIRVCAYTGMRLREAAQLARKNVRKIDGVWCVEVDDLDGRSVKTRSSVKQVPLHPAIRDQFVEWVQRGRGSLVFASFGRPSDRVVNKLSGDFGRLMDRAGLDDPRLTFHSLRHTLKRETNNARLDPDMRRQILGHAPRTAHDDYEGASLPALADELARMPPLF